MPGVEIGGITHQCVIHTRNVILLQKLENCLGLRHRGKHRLSQVDDGLQRTTA
jgi:hypothetical protein